MDAVSSSSSTTVGPRGRFVGHSLSSASLSGTSSSSVVGLFRPLLIGAGLLAISALVLTEGA
jgi:hypothetical protein